MSDGRNGGCGVNVLSSVRHSGLSCVSSHPLPAPPSIPFPPLVPPECPQSCSFTTSSLGLAPPKMAELGLAT